MPDFPQPQKSSGWDIALPAILGLVAGALPGLGRGVNAGLGVAQMMQKRNEDQLARQREEWTNNSVSDMFGSSVARARKPLMEPVVSPVTTDPMTVMSFNPLSSLFPAQGAPPSAALDAAMKKTVANNTPSDTGTADMGAGRLGFWNATAPDEEGSNLLNSRLDVAQAAAKARQWDMAAKNLAEAQSMQEKSAERIRDRRSFNEFVHGPQPGPGARTSFEAGGWSASQNGEPLAEKYTDETLGSPQGDQRWRIFAGGRKEYLGPGVSHERPARTTTTRKMNGSEGWGEYEKNPSTGAWDKIGDVEAPASKVEKSSVNVVDLPVENDDGTRTMQFYVDIKGPDGSLDSLGPFSTRSEATAEYQRQRKIQAGGGETLSRVGAYVGSNKSTPAGRRPVTAEEFLAKKKNGK